jgi:putative membrane protein
MRHDFSRPQRQSLLGILVMSADSLQGTARALFPILIITLLKGEKSKMYFGIIAAAALIFAIITGYLKFRNFTFFIDEENDEFVVRKGILSKTRIAIPLNKIQQVNISQNLIQKLLKVHALEVDTAGSSKTEVSIKAITESYALALKERLLEEGLLNNIISEEATENRQARPPFIRISLVSLLKTGITSNYIRSFGILLAFFLSTFQHLDDYFTYTGTNSGIIDDYFNTKFLLRFIAFIVLLILVLTLLVNLGRTVLRFYDFKVTKQGNALLLSHGLINTRNTIIRPEKVQTVTVGRNFFQKKFNINDLKISQASDMEHSRERQKMAMEIPGVNEAEKNALLTFLLGEVPHRGFAVKPNFRKLIFQVFKMILIPVGLFYCYVLLSPETAEMWPVVPVYVLFVGILIYFGFRNNRLFISPEFIIYQRGAWDVDNTFVAPNKIQNITLHQFFWQKMSDVGTIKIYTAGGAVSFGLANFTQLKKLANYWLYQVETDVKGWM